MLECNYFIIGAGETGLILAEGLAKLGKKVILAEQGELGGSYLVSKEIPQKLLSQESESFSSSLKIFKDHPETFTVLRKHRQKLHNKLVHNLKQKSAEIIKRLDNYANLTILEGIGEFTSKRLAEVNSESQRHLISFENAIICVGKNTMAKPELTGLDTVPFLHQHSVFLFSQIPSSLGIIGITPENLEIANIYSDLGVKVEIFDQEDAAKAIKRLDRSGFNYTVKQLLTKQVEFHFNTKIDKVTQQKDELILNSGIKKKFSFSHIYCGVKEIFQGSSLKLDIVGVTHSRRGIATSLLGQTQHRHIWAFGECNSNCSPDNKYTQVYNYLNRQASEAEKKSGLLGSITSTSSDLKLNPIPRIAINLENGLVQIGYSESDAHSKFGSLVKSEIVDHQLLSGFLKIIYRQNSGQVLGVVMTGDFAKKLDDLVTKAMEKTFMYKDFRNYLKAVWGM